MPLSMFALIGTLASPVALAKEDDWDFNLEGYYRTRGYVFSQMATDGKAEGSKGWGNYMVHRLRIQPEINFQDRAKFIMMADLIDDVVWGDNSSLMPASIFAQDPGYTHMTGNDQDFFRRQTAGPIIKRAWMEFKVPVGLVRVGRQESNWGMGILSNNGNGMEEGPVGENHWGSTFDRVMFATRPIAVIQGIAGKEDSGIPFFTAVGVDRLVEDPLDTYYGYKCATQDPAEEYITQDTHPDAYDPRCDTIDSTTQQTGRDGIHDIDHDYVEEGRAPSDRDDLYFMDRSDDAWEMFYVAIYRGEDVNLFGSRGDFTFGSYVIDRRHDESNSRVQIYDVYTKFLRKGVYFEGEVVNIRGKTSGLALPGTYDPNSSLPNPLYKEADIWGWAARTGYLRQAYSAIMEAGFSSGDENVADDQFTARPLHPDYNVGLILYEEVLSRVTQRTWSDEAYALWSRGGVWNSYYIYPHVRVRPMDNWEFNGAFLLAWPHKPDGSRILCQASDDVKCVNPSRVALAQEIGWEVDASIKTTFHEHVNFTLESGYAKISNRVPLGALGLDPEGKFFTLQSRIAYEF